MERLTNGALGSYTYGDSAHVHAVTSIGSAYTATYDAAGNKSCRAPTTATTCAGSTPTGAQLSYDNEGRLSHWQNAPSSPTATDTFLYDGEGNRVAQQVTQNGTTTTVYVGNLEEVSTSGSTTTTTTYYYAGNQQIAVAVNGTFSYLATDALGSISVALNATGAVQGSQLFSPYGWVRYSTGTMPGSYGFTGQHTDNVTGLDYYNARYYDPSAGQFISADTILPGKGYDPWGLSRYAYVEGNPETRTDPSGHCPFCIGALVGALVGGGVSLVTQAADHGWDFSKVNYGRVAVDTALGAVAGALITTGVGASVGMGMAFSGLTGGLGAMLGKNTWTSAWEGSLIGGIGSAAATGAGTLVKALAGGASVTSATIIGAGASLAENAGQQGLQMLFEGAKWDWGSAIVSTVAGGAISGYGQGKANSLDPNDFPTGHNGFGKPAINLKAYFKQKDDWENGFSNIRGTSGIGGLIWNILPIHPK